MKNLQHSNYPSFEKSLKIDFGKYPPETQKELKEQMTLLRYRIKNGEKIPPSDAQLDYAWNFLVRQGIIEEKRQRLITEYYKIEIYRKRKLYRATSSITINNKKYRKGQFLPKR
jgi:hypothetical protein